MQCTCIIIAVASAGSTVMTYCNRRTQQWQSDFSSGHCMPCRAGLAWSRLVICSRSSRLSCTAAAAMPTPPQRSTLGLTTCRRATRLCKQLNSCSHTALQVGRNSRAAAAAAIAAGSIAVAAAAQGGTTAALTAVQPPAVAEQHQGLTFLQVGACMGAGQGRAVASACARCEWQTHRSPGRLVILHRQGWTAAEKLWS